MNNISTKPERERERKELGREGGREDARKEGRKAGETFKHRSKRNKRIASMLGASSGDPTHDKVMRRRPDKQGLRTRGTPWASPIHDKVMRKRPDKQGLKEPPWTCSSIYPKTRICLSYCFMPFTNSSDINRGLSLTTFLQKKST